MSGHVVKSKTMALPSGYRPPGYKAARISVSFDDSQFETLRDYAKANGISFGQAVRVFLNTAISARRRTEVNSAHKFSED